MFDMPVCDAIRANRGGGFCLLYCLFRHVEGERRTGVVLRALLALDSVYFLVGGFVR